VNIVFLDIDGVLNNVASLAEGIHLLPEKAILVHRICQETDARIVISSSWRIGRSLNRMQDLLQCAGCWSTVLDVTRELPGPRGNEIQDWLDSGVVNIDNYLILDDDDDMLDSQREFFIHTDIQTGLMSRELPRAIEILNG